MVEKDSFSLYDETKDAVTTIKLKNAVDDIEATDKVTTMDGKNATDDIEVADDLTTVEEECMCVHWMR